MKKRSLMIMLAIVCVVAICGATVALAAWISGTKSDTQTLHIGTNEIVVDLGSAVTGGTNEFYPGSYMTFTYTVEITDTASETPITEADIAVSLVAVDGTDDAEDFFTVGITGNATAGKVANGETITITVTMNPDAERPDFTSVTLSVVLS